MKLFLRLLRFAILPVPLRIATVLGLGFGGVGSDGPAASAPSASGPAASAPRVSFARDVQPLLASRCFACHGPDTSESGLALHERDAALVATAAGEPAIVAGDPNASELIRRVTSHDEGERMPPEGKPLSDGEVAILRAWISAGARYEKHWAFVPPRKEPPPQVAAKNKVANPIDAYIIARLEAKGLEPAPQAEKRVLARRVYFDVTGLPPKPEEMAEFLADDRPNAYEELVDRLLASPRYGEKWGRHWLDVVRYAETNSFERDAAKPFVWKYRDYVIRSLNEDKPYDQFVREQLAGDELDEVTVDSITATGYYRLGTWDDEPADPLQARYDDLDNIVSTTGQAFLGLTVGCARCHDHKIDPVPQTDYYGMLAFFADVTPYGTREDQQSNSQLDLSGPLQKKRRQAIEAEGAALREQAQAIEESGIAKMSDTDQRRAETHERRELLREKLEQYVTDAEYRQYRDLRRRMRGVRDRLKELPPAEYVLALAECDPHPETTHVMLRGNPTALGDPVEPCYPELFGEAPPEIPLAPPEARSAGRRRVLADWITQPENLLSSRVIANRVWQHHFGRGIVRTANNFGLLGDPPTHPELLDWLALWLVEHDWKLKPLHKLILMSNTYRMSSAATDDGLAVDPANDLFWRFDMRRLTAEEIRDTALYVSGRLNEQMHGPSVYPQLSEEVYATQSRPGEGWPTSSPRDAARRSVYIHIKRSLIPPALANFDFPETDTSCEARFNTTQAAQALNMLHGDFMQTQAGHLAERVAKEGGDDLDGQLGHALRLALQREPDKATIADGLKLVGKYREEFRLNEHEALRQYCLMVLNLNEFIYLD